MVIIGRYSYSIRQRNSWDSRTVTTDLPQWGRGADWVAPPPVQLGHEIESHTIDPGDQGHHGGQRHPCRDLAHVAVLLHANMSQGGLDERGQHLVKVVYLFRRVVLVLDDLTDVARQRGE